MSTAVDPRTLQQVDPSTIDAALDAESELVEGRDPNRRRARNRSRLQASISAAFESAGIDEAEVRSQAVQVMRDLGASHSTVTNRLTLSEQIYGDSPYNVYPTQTALAQSNAIDHLQRSQNETIAKIRGEEAYYRTSISELRALQGQGQTGLSDDAFDALISTHQGNLSQLRSSRGFVERQGDNFRAAIAAGDYSSLPEAFRPSERELGVLATEQQNEQRTQATVAEFVRLSRTNDRASRTVAEIVRGSANGSYQSLDSIVNLIGEVVPYPQAVQIFGQEEADIRVRDLHGLDDNALINPSLEVNLFTPSVQRQILSDSAELLGRNMAWEELDTGSFDPAFMSRDEVRYFDDYRAGFVPERTGSAITSTRAREANALEGIEAGDTITVPLGEGGQFSIQPDSTDEEILAILERAGIEIQEPEEEES